MQLGGRVADKLYLSQVNSGAMNDLLEATDMSYKLVEESRYVWLRTLWRKINQLRGRRPVPFSEKMADFIDAEVVKNLKKAEQQTQQILTERNEEMKKVQVVPTLVNDIIVYIFIIASSLSLSLPKML